MTLTYASSERLSFIGSHQCEGAFSRQLAVPSERSFIIMFCDPCYRAFAGTHIDSTEFGTSERGLGGTKQGVRPRSEGATLTGTMIPVGVPGTTLGLRRRQDPTAAERGPDPPRRCGSPGPRWRCVQRPLYAHSGPPGLLTPAITSRALRTLAVMLWLAGLGAERNVSAMHGRA